MYPYTRLPVIEQKSLSGIVEGENNSSIPFNDSEEPTTIVHEGGTVLKFKFR